MELEMNRTGHQSFDILKDAHCRARQMGGPTYWNGILKRLLRSKVDGERGERK